MRRRVFYVRTKQYSTLHEIANALHSSQDKQQGPCPSLRIVLIPGTFFPPQSSSALSIAEPTLLASLLSFLSATPHLIPLTFAHTSISLPVPPNNEKSEGSPTSASSDDVISIVVTSTPLHTAILHDSEALCASVPGTKRFKLAAAQSSTTWYRARACLLTPVQQYDVNADAFVPTSGEEDTLELQGPFVYFLSTVNVDRLEPLFQIVLLQRALPPPPDVLMMDVQLPFIIAFIFYSWTCFPTFIALAPAT